MNFPRRNGFTLLELVISCTILVTIFSLATAALTRVHRLRADSESQTRLMTEGRALLDDIANQLAYVAGTNIWISEDAAGKDNDKLTLAIIRYAVHPQSRKSGDASDETPYYAMRLDFSAGDLNNPTSSVERIARSAIDNEILSSNVNRVTYGTVRRDTSTITNAYAAEEMGTHIPSAPKGETISVPITFGSSATTYGSRTSFDASIAIWPSSSEGTNTVFADIVFEGTNSGERAISIPRPTAGSWPQPSTRTLRIRQETQIHAENIVTNAFMAAGYLDYENVPLSMATFPTEETNATARTILAASVEAYDSIPPPGYTNTNDVVQVLTNDVPASVTNDVPASVTNDVPTSVTNDVPTSVTNDVPASVTNDVPASVTNDVPTSVTNGVPASVTNGVPTSVTNNVPVSVTNDVPASVTNETTVVFHPDTPYASSTNRLVTGELLFGPYDAPYVVSNYWAWGESADIDTNGIISGVSIVLNGRTNMFASAADVAASSTSTVIYADANFQFSEILDLLSVDLNEGNGVPGSLSNLVATAFPIAFTNEFAPKGDFEFSLPLHVSEILAYEERLSPESLATAFSVQSSVAAAGTNATPLAYQSYEREMELVIVREVTTNGIAVRVAHDWRTRTNYRLLFDVDASLAPTNSLTYGGITTNIFPNGTSYDSETRWHDVVLEDDFNGADERTAGIWLREEGNRDITELLVKTNSASIPYARPKAADAVSNEESLAPAIWNSIQKVVITPLCFSTNENQRLDLMVWDPEDDPPGPPVCADIYLELLAPAHQRRAKRIPEGDSRDRYIQNHVIRISRRAPIGTARKELP